MPTPDPHLHQPRSTMASPTPPQTTLQEPSPKKKNKKPSKPTWLLRRFRSVFHSFSLLNQPCKMPAVSHHIHGGSSTTSVTGTLFGRRKARVTLAVQDNPRCIPILLLELAIPTTKLLQEMGSGLVRIALESEKRSAEKTKLVEEPLWTMYGNGKKSGYAVRRDPSEEDLKMMETLRAVSMGAGVLPGESGKESGDGELAYVRAYFERIVGSRDSETLYMVNPDGNSGPELSIFFVRI